MQVAGLEPVLGNPNKHLKLARLPIPPYLHTTILFYTIFLKLSRPIFAFLTPFTQKDPKFYLGSLLLHLVSQVSFFS